MRGANPIMAGAPDFKPDASQSAAERAMQSGMFHDGMHYFPLPKGSNSPTHALVGINYEYTDDNLLSTDGMPTALSLSTSASQVLICDSMIAT